MAGGVKGLCEHRWSAPPKLQRRALKAHSGCGDGRVFRSRWKGQKKYWVSGEKLIPFFFLCGDNGTNKGE